MDNPDLHSFFNDLHYRLEIFRVGKKRTDLYLSSDFNVFDYIYPDENLLSDIISELLKPSGKHGQGNVFLRSFLLEMSSSLNPNLDIPYKVIREDTTRYIHNKFRRIDISIEFGDGSVVSIENKPWAIEQKDQVKDYVDNLNKKFRGNFVLVYLSYNGRDPESIEPSIRDRLKAEGKLVVVPYNPKLILWLERCMKECESDKMKWFLRDFIKHISRNFQITEEEEGES